MLLGELDDLVYAFIKTANDNVEGERVRDEMVKKIHIQTRQILHFDCF